MTSESPSKFTQRELELLAGAMLCLKSGEIAVDYKKFAEHCNFKNANSAKASWCGLRKKIDKFAQGSSTDSESAPSKRKNSNDDDDEAPSAKKRSKKPVKEEAKSEAESEEDAVEADTKEDEVVTPKDEGEQ
ncbi:hypothetical protein AMS68_003355 [Peltaster fructicola]|uniref:Uncharacterized protein n=1 Tax=Peltaster fructicola TaxID=286661 RepID=A0A6H0XT90_9PEZI|nr:hypothetical protein AMS68_003355 [Peltaster fructicola]